ncbi:hypothetical protein TRM7615_00656 [Falsiruegeria mediterranea M17]|uniref:site-specific DNA-methyltransferase (adenine-specific) n=1 Tax=Falsiruegeria mediterranea M17 TaxID=1200281 RepID=A0A2R8C413_9RHOB|nr:hypothetical protein TRM7615_00656 [Falsiruegeria mediterranea M17]
MVFKKCKENEDVLFVDASSCFEKGKNQNNLRDKDVDRIVEAYRIRAEEERFSHRANLAEIRENEFNLNIPRYVDTYDPEPDVDLEATTRRIHDLNLDMKEVDETMRSFCAELGLEAPV